MLGHRPRRPCHEQSWVLALLLILFGLVAMVATNYFRDVFQREAISDLEARVEALEKARDLP